MIILSLATKLSGKEKSLLKIRSNVGKCADESLFHLGKPPYYQIALASLPGSGRHWLYHLIKLATGTEIVNPDHFLDENIKFFTDSSEEVSIPVKDTDEGPTLQLPPNFDAQRIWHRKDPVIHQFRQYQ